MANLIITGGAGFIGANFVRHWRKVSPNDGIVVLDALTYAGNPANIAETSSVHKAHAKRRKAMMSRGRCVRTSAQPGVPH